MSRTMHRTEISLDFRFVFFFSHQVKSLWCFMTPSRTLQLPLISAWLSQLWPIRKENTFRSTQDVLILPWRAVFRADHLRTLAQLKALSHLAGFDCYQPFLYLVQHPACTLWWGCGPCCFCKWSRVWVINHQHSSISHIPKYQSWLLSPWSYKK